MENKPYGWQSSKEQHNYLTHATRLYWGGRHGTPEDARREAVRELARKPFLSHFVVKENGETVEVWVRNGRGWKKAA